jgi:hypothetical protein
LLVVWWFYGRSHFSTTNAHLFDALAVKFGNKVTKIVTLLAHCVERCNLQADGALIIRRRV